MEIYPLNPLAQVFKLRRDRAERALQKMRAALQKAKLDKLAAEKELNDYKQWWPKEERRLFEAAMGQLLDHDAMEVLKGHERKFRVREIELQERVLAKEKTLAEAQEQCNQARAQLKKAEARLDKFAEQKQAWDGDQQVLEERFFEKEAEEQNYRRGELWHAFSLETAETTSF